MSSTTRQATWAAVSVAGLGLVNLCWAQQPKSASELAGRPSAKQEKVDPDHQLVTGVVEKVDRSEGKANAGGSPDAVTLTINSSAVWRDFVRTTSETPGQIQAATKDKLTKESRKAGPPPDASISVDGQPDTVNSRLVVQVERNAQVHRHYRAASDEFSAGAPTPEQALQVATQDKSATNPAVSPASKTNATGRPTDSKTPKDAGEADALAMIHKGQFVRIEYRKDGERNVATRVLVLQPVASPAADASDK